MLLGRRCPYASGRGGTRTRGCTYARLREEWTGPALAEHPRAATRRAVSSRPRPEWAFPEVFLFSSGTPRGLVDDAEIRRWPMFAVIVLYYRLRISCPSSISIRIRSVLD
jgi:hypothetical protein